MRTLLRLASGLQTTSVTAMTNHSTAPATLDPWRWRWLILVVGIFALDQGSKWIVATEMVYGERIQLLPFFAWVRWHNTGAAFSFLADAGGWQRWFFVVIGLGFSAYIIRELSRLTLGERWMGLVYGLILGGALGNLYGRLVNGYVVDFILVHYREHIFPAFNVADSALFLGVALWLYLMFQEGRAAKAPPGT